MTSSAPDLDAIVRISVVHAERRIDLAIPGRLPLVEVLRALDEEVLAVVERKSLEDLTSSLASGKMAYRMGELETVPHAAVVVEERYSEIFKLTHVRPALIADLLGESQVRWPSVPIIFAETRALAEEWTFRFLGAAVAEHTMGEQARRVLPDRSDG